MSTETHILPSLDLLEFQLFDWLQVNQSDGREIFSAISETARRLAIDKFLPHYRQSDIEEPYLDGESVHVLPAIQEALGSFADLGFFGASFAEEAGGFGLSFAVSLAIHSNFSAANISTANYAMLTVANARLISTFGTPEQIEQFALPEIAGRWLGTMCLSEPQAGSSLGDIQTRAKSDGEDAFGKRYRLSGNKMWISGGDQNISENIVHLVLAKIADEDGTLPEGTKGISLFIVPKFLPDGSRNDVAVAGLNHKMGNRGTSNCLLNFGENDGAVGWLIGGPGQGLSQMFMMMNEARISVGMGAAALAYRGYRQSLRYTRERTQGRLVGNKGGSQVEIIEHPDIRRMLLQQKSYAEGAIAICLYCASLHDQDTAESATLLALLTPVAKSWPSEFGCTANDLAIQIHGGYGYTRDFDVEQLWRDNRLNPIHEGTTGIQAIDLLSRKLIHSDGKAFDTLQARIRATTQRAKRHREYALFAENLLDFWRDAENLITQWRNGELETIANATVFLRAFGHGVIAWLWLDMAVASYSLAPTPFRSGLGSACRYFFESELPQAKSWLSVAARRSVVHAITEQIFE